MKNFKQYKRREFLGQISCAGMGYMTLMNSLINLKAINAASISNSDTNGYKAIVCILQAGGNDSFNTLIPITDHAEYVTTRSNLSIPLVDDPGPPPVQGVLPLNGSHNGKSYGVHPSMTGVRELYHSGRLSFVSNVGTLMDSTSKQDYLSNAAYVPLGLFSHSDQIQQWQTAIKDQRTAIGWGGKIADMINDQNQSASGNISMNITLSGTNIFQAGNDTVEFAINENGSIGMNQYGNTNNILQTLRTNAVTNLMAHNYQDIFKNTFKNTMQNSHDAHVEFSSALNSFNGFNTVDPFSNSNPVSQDLKMIASTIGMQQTLGFNRQIFFLNFGGWDHHDSLVDRHGGMIGMLSDAMKEFNDGLTLLGLEDCVLTFTTSEFGRTLTSNGDGSDHAWGGNVMVMGGPSLINGQQIFGTYPSLELDGPNDIGNGVILPTTPIDSYFAEIAKWFGVGPTDLSDIFPQIGNFYNVNSSNYPIGFIK